MTEKKPLKPKKFSPRWRNTRLVLGLTLTTASIFALIGVFISKAIWNSYTEDVLRSSHQLAERFNQTLANSLNSGLTTDEAVERFQNLLEQVPYGEDGFVCLIDQEYEVVSHPNKKMVGSTMAVEKLEPFQATMITHDAPLEGKKYLMDSPAFPGKHMVYQLSEDSLPWRVSIHSNLDEHRTRIQHIQSQILFFAFPMLILIPWAGSLVVRGITNKYESALENANRDLEKTVSKRTEELRETNQELSIAKVQAESSDRLKAEFLAVMSHEYRTPLNGILGLATILKESAEDEDCQEIATDILESGNRLHHLLKRILFFASIESGSTKMEYQSVYANDIATNLENDYGKDFEAKGISLDIAYENDPTDAFDTCPIHLNQAIRELTENALKFTPSGEVCIRMKTESDTFHFTIEDTGIGIPSDKVESLFEPFVQADSSLSRSHEGVGIGLVMTKRIAERLDGGVSFKAKPDGGSKFSFYIPVKVLSVAETVMS